MKRRLKLQRAIFAGNPFDSNGHASDAFDDICDSLFEGNEKCEDCGLDPLTKCNCEDKE